MMLTRHGPPFIRVVLRPSTWRVRTVLGRYSPLTTNSYNLTVCLGNQTQGKSSQASVCIDHMCSSKPKYSLISRFPLAPNAISKLCGDMKQCSIQNYRAMYYTAWCEIKLSVPNEIPGQRSNSSVTIPILPRQHRKKRVTLYYTTQLVYISW